MIVGVEAEVVDGVVAGRAHLRAVEIALLRLQQPLRGRCRSRARRRPRRRRPRRAARAASWNAYDSDATPPSCVAVTGARTDDAGRVGRVADAPDYRRELELGAKPAGVDDATTIAGEALQVARNEVARPSSCARGRPAASTPAHRDLVGDSWRAGRIDERAAGAQLASLRLDRVERARSTARRCSPARGARDRSAAPPARRRGRSPTARRAR